MRFLLISIVALFALYSHAETDYETKSVCSDTQGLANQAQFKKPSGNHEADFIAVDKKRRLVHLFQDGKIFRSYHAALGRSPVGKKIQSGDNKTPEGLYYIDSKNSASDYHLSLHISYPNQDDINYAREKGVDAGGDIMIHGLPNSFFKRLFINHPNNNWTRGCVAVNNSEIEEIFDYVKTSTPIELCP